MLHIPYAAHPHLLLPEKLANKIVGFKGGIGGFLESALLEKRAQRLSKFFQL
jgi:hypothetical protein